MTETCTWCGHPPHRTICPRDILVSAGASQGRKVVNRTVACPCRKHQFPDP